jgi:hypothetical protein
MAPLKDKVLFDCWPHKALYRPGEEVRLVIREGTAAKLISIINLSRCGETYWNTGKPEPVEGGEISFSLQVDFEVKGIWRADPEQEGGAMSALPWTRRKTNRGYYMDFTIPRTGLWTLIYIELLNHTFFNGV